MGGSVRKTALAESFVTMHPKIYKYFIFQPKNLANAALGHYLHPDIFH